MFIYIKKIFVLILFFVLTTKIYGQYKGVITVFIDPKMMIEGPYEDSAKGGLDIMLRTSNRNQVRELGIELEAFKAMDYYSAGVFYNRIIHRTSKLELLLGGQVGVINRPKLVGPKPTFALNGEARYFFSRNWGVSALSNFKYRSDLVSVYKEKNPLKFNGYLGIVYRW